MSERPNPPGYLSVRKARDRFLDETPVQQVCECIGILLEEKNIKATYRYRIVYPVVNLSGGSLLIQLRC